MTDQAHVSSSDLRSAAVREVLDFLPDGGGQNPSSGALREAEAIVDRVLAAVGYEALREVAQTLSDTLDVYRLWESASFVPSAEAHDALRNVLDGSPTTKEQSE